MSGVITVELQDGSGDPAVLGTDATIELTSSSSGTYDFRQTDGTTSLPGSPQTITIPAGDSDGSFTYYDSTAGTPAITASDSTDGLADAYQLETVNPVATKIVFGTDSQTLTAGTVSNTITVKLQDGEGDTASLSTDATVSLTSTSAGTHDFRETDGTTSLPGSPQTITIPADQSAVSFTYYDEAAGTPTITASDSADSLTQATQDETVNPGPLDHFEVDAPGSTTAGDSFGVTVTAYDGFGNVKTDYAGTVEFSSSDTGADTALPGDYTFTTGESADDGVHTFDGVVLTTTPSQTVSVDDISDRSKTGTSDPITVNPGPLDHFQVDAPGSTTAGDPLSVTVTAYDGYGNVKTDYAGTVEFSSSDTGADTALPGDYTFTTSAGGPPEENVHYDLSTDDGVHTFTDGVTLTTTPSQTVSVDDISDNTKSGASGSITVNPGPLDHFVWTKEPASPQVAGASWGSDATEVTAYDAYDNVKTDYGGSAATLGGLGTSPAPASHAPDYGTLSWSAGVGTVDDVVDYAAESASLTITDSDAGVGPTATDAVTVEPASLDHFVWTKEPASPQVAGVSWGSDAAEVTAYDAYDNVKTDYGGSAAALGGLGTSPAPASHAPDYGTLSWSAGVGTVDGVVDYKAELASLTITDSDADVGPTASSPVMVKSGPLDHFVWTKEPSSPQVAGASWGSDGAEVTAYDAYDNVKRDYAGAHASLGGLGTSPAPVSDPPGYGTLSWSAGVGTASGVIDYKAESASLTITDSNAGVGPTATDAVTVTPAPVDHFEYGSPSPSPEAGVQSTMQVTAYDAYENPSTSSLGTPTLSSNLDGSPRGCSGPCSVSKSLSAFSSDGTATATITFKAYKAEGGRTVTVTSGGNSASTASAPFVVAPNIVDHFEFGAPSPSAEAGVQSTMSVTAYDQYENLSTTSLGTPSLSSNLDGSPRGCSGPCSVSQSLSAFSGDGSAAATVTFKAYKAEGGRTVTVSAGGDSASTTSSAFVVAPNVVDHFEFGAPSPSPVVAGVQSSMSVSAFDAYENATTNSLSPAVLSSTHVDGSSVGCGAGNAHPCTAATNLGAFNGSGVATATFTAYKAESGASLTVTASDAAASTSDTFVVTPAPVDHFEYGAPSPSPVTAGVPSTMGVSAFDQYENASSNQLTAVTLSTTMNPSSQGCSGPCSPSVNVSTPFDANGVGAVTFTGYKAETGRTVTVTAHDGAHTASPTFAVLAGKPASVSFTRQPNEVEALTGASCTGGTPPDPNACFIDYYTTPRGVQVLAKDTWGNAANNNAQIAITLTTGPGTLAGGGAIATQTDGTATFTSLTINAIGIGDKITATATPAANGSNPSNVTAVSQTFDVANQLQLCNHSCSGSASEPNKTTDSVTISGSGSTDTLGIALSTETVPTGACPGWAPAPQSKGGPPLDWTYTDITSTSGSLPAFTITWELAKALVNLNPDNGAAHYDICLGTVWIGTGPVQPWVTKAGKPAVGYPGVGQYGAPVTRYWGLVPNCTPGKGLTPTNPCIISRSKDSAGDVLVVFKIPAGWDPHHNGGI